MLGASLACAAHAYDPEEKVFAKAGTMPVILTVPHDGADSLGWIAARSKGVTMRDEGTQDIAERTVAAIERKSGLRPYIVIAKFNRRFLDANRAEKDAMESPDALPAYQAYHGHVARFVKEARERFPEGAVLIDVHGQADDVNTIFRGTRSGGTVRALTAKHGKAALVGPDSIGGVLQLKGYRIFPETDSDAKEDGRFNGGHTVFHYGSGRPGGIDALQFEFGRGVRGSNLPEDFADAILVFSKKYLAFPK